MLWGLPALIAGLGFAGFAATAGVRARGLDEEYRAAADAAYDADEPAPANLYYRRLAELDGGAPRTRFRLAETYESLDRPDAAGQLLAGLTEDVGGYPPAHRAAAARLLEAPGAPDDPFANRRRLAAAFRHLKLARRGAPDDVDVAVELARVLLAAGEDRAALPLIREAADARPDLRLDEGVVAARLGESAAAARAFAAAEAHFAVAVADDPGDDASRLRWAEALAKLGRLDDAAAALEEGLRRSPDAFAAPLSRVRLFQSDAVGRAGGAPAMRLAMLRDALRLTPRDPQALMRLIAFADGDGAASDESNGDGAGGSGADAAALLRSILARGDVPAAAHLALGTRAWSADDADAAAFHLEQAYRLDPSLGPVANNLAWVLAHRPDPDLDRALRVIDATVARWPDEPAYRDTRGDVYRLLERPADALADLEFALAGGLGSPDLHARLASVYDDLGRSELAETHRALAREPADDGAGTDNQNAAGADGDEPDDGAAT